MSAQLTFSTTDDQEIGRVTLDGDNLAYSNDTVREVMEPTVAMAGALNAFRRFTDWSNGYVVARLSDATRAFRPAARARLAVRQTVVRMDMVSLGIITRWDAAEHPRNPKGSPGGGKFRSLVDRVRDALHGHATGDGSGKPPLDGFDREQVRKAAVSMGLKPRRGASEHEIKAMLVQHHASETHQQDEPSKPADKKAPPKADPPLSAVDKEAKPASVPSKEERDRAILGDAEYERRQSAKASKRAPAKKAAPKESRPTKRAPAAKAPTTYQTDNGGRITTEEAGRLMLGDAEYERRQAAKATNRAPGKAVPTKANRESATAKRARQERVDAMAAGLHEDWRQTFRKTFRQNPDNVGKEPTRPKTTTDQAWIASHGTDQVDIANTDFAELPEDWQDENRTASEVIDGIVGRLGEDIDLNDPATRLQVGEDIHAAWLERHPEAAGGPLGVPFAQLPKVEQDRDIDQMQVALSARAAAKTLTKKALPRKRTPAAKAAPSAAVETRQKTDIPTFTMPAEAKPEDVAALRDKLRLKDPSAHSLHDSARSIGENGPEATQKLAAKVGPVAARRVAREADIENAFGRFLQVQRPEDPNADPYADLPPLTPKEIADGKAKAEAALKDELAGKKVAIRVQPAGLAAILRDGRMKTAFDTGRSGSLGGSTQSYRKKRKDAEEMLFGIPTDAPADKRPIYGYVATDGLGPTSDSGFLAQYGRIQVVLKDSVRHRTTASVGDSIDDDTLPSPIDDPSWQSFNGSAHLTKGYGAPSSAWFTEAHVHGGVTTDDIEEVLFDEEPTPDLAKQLKAAGVPYRVAGAPTKDATPAAPAVTAPAPRSAAAPRVTGRDLTAGSTSASAARRFADVNAYPSTNGSSAGPHGDELAAGIAAQQGFDGPPSVVSRAEMDRLIADGNVEMHRGVYGAGGLPAAAIHEQLRSGDPYYSIGAVYGSGTYAAALSRAKAEYYADGTPGSVARMSLHKDARVVSYEDLKVEQAKYLRPFDGPEDEYRAFNDPGRYAAARGYDAILVPGPPAEYVVLNRTALIVQEAE